MTPSIGSPVFARGFRPFFLGASLLGTLWIVAWLGVLFGMRSLGGRSPVLSHGHEMVYGYALAVIAGFLLTAVQNWTGHATASGSSLALLFGLWGIGRLAVWLEPGSAQTAAQLAELAFLPVLALVLGRCIVAARNWRNAGFLVLLAGLWLCDLGYAFGSDPAFALTRAVDLIVMMIVIIGGRVIPIFTRNGLGDPEVGSWPRIDQLTLLAVIATFAASLAGLPGPALASLEALSTLLVVMRMIPWKSHRTFGNPLVWILHLGYAWVAAGFALRALHHAQVSAIADSAAGVVLGSLGLHAHTAGAIGVMTLGMMARVALGHTGRALIAPPGIPVAFGLMALASILRVLPALISIEWYRPSLLLAGALFALAQLIYFVVYWPILTRPRIDDA